MRNYLPKSAANSEPPEGDREAPFRLNLFHQEFRRALHKDVFTAHCQ